MRERIQDTDSLDPAHPNDPLASGENPWAVIIPHSILSADPKEKDCAKLTKIIIHGSEIFKVKS